MGRTAHFPPKIHQHKRGYSYCRVYRQGRPHDVRLGPPGSEQARQRYAALCAELSGAVTGHDQPVTGRDQTVSGRDQTVTVADVLAAFDLHARQHASPGELKLLRIVGRVLTRTFGTLEARAFTPGRLEELQAVFAAGTWRTAEETSRLEYRGRPVGWCRNVVNRQAVRVRTIWRWAERRDLVPPGSWAALQTVPGLSKASRLARHTAPRRPCTADELDAVCGHAAPAVAAMLRVGWFSGARPGEVRTMKAEDIDRTADVWVYRPAADKNSWRDGHAPRVVALGPECQRVLAPFLEAAVPGAYLFRPDARRSKRDHYTLRSYGRAVARACERAGVKIIAYSCRHSAKQRITREMGLDAARCLLGQTSIGTTNGYAAGIDEETAREVARKMG